jgi:hypothetical protein
MTAEQQVCTYKQALELKRLGINAPAFFIWWWDHDSNLKCYPYSSPGYTLRGAERDEKAAWAYNVAELGELLMEHMNGRLLYPAIITTVQDKQTEACMRAEELIHKLRTGYLSPAGVNNKLCTI